MIGIIMMNQNDHYASSRERMIKDQLMRRGISDKRVLDAFRAVQRHLFVLPQDNDAACEDYPLPIGFGQTISQPYIVAYMVQELGIKATDTILEIGTGSGYEAAILGELAAKVYTIEVIPELYQRASKLLASLHYKNIECRLGDGHEGIPDRAPFDKIVLSASPETMPALLLDQLKVGGRLIAPLGSIKLFQRLVLIEKQGEERFKKTELMGVSFVEMV